MAMFGVGRALLLSDRVTRDYKELRGSGPGPVLNRLRGDVQGLAGRAVTRVADRVSGSGQPTSTPKAPKAPAARPPAKAGKPPVVEPEIAVGKPSPAASGRTAETAAPRPKTTPEPTARPEPPARPAAEPTTAPKARIAPESLPVPDYDQATLPSLRGRLRGLSIEQVRLLRAYERENAARADVLRMFENRIVKLGDDG
ncbi:hypothetical protein [Actinomadura alba]|uniref:DUF8129 domain-containing protein n=1 Tax=Actinomadura alba TaxID=406431 RepID=A0ABR7LQI8_9ACTN|nr:hypothetical protein [Actinomadura alba]MBC6467105.1 hypothetical protein [Actinomadura alba]